MESENQKINWFYLCCFLLGICGLGLYKLLKPETGDAPLYLYLCKEVGMALVIAIILIYTIEKASRKQHELAADRLMANIQKNLFHSVYKRYIPDDVFNEVEKCLLNNNLHRTDYKLLYTLRELNTEEHTSIAPRQANDHLGLELYSSYTLHNLSDSPQKEWIKFGIEVPNEHLFKCLTSIKSFQINDVEQICENNPISVSEGDHLQELVFNKEVELPAKGSIRVSMVGFTVKRSIDADLWASRIPSSGVEITVVAPSGCKVECKANHSQKLIRKTTTSSGPIVWHLPHGIIPHQSIAIWWNYSKPPVVSVLEVNKSTDASPESDAKSTTSPEVIEVSADKLDL